MSEPTPYARDSSALAFALTRTKLSLPYSVEVACDLEQFSLAARQEAGVKDVSVLLLPSNHKSQQLKVCMDQPSSEHLISLEACFLCSETQADDPAVTHASLRML